MPNDIWTNPSGPAAGVASRSEMTQQRTDNLFVVEKVLFDGDASASGKVHRHKTGTLATRPAPGSAGRIYLPTDLGVMLVDDGTEWLIGQHFAQKAERFCDDFISNSVGIWETTVVAPGEVAWTPGSAGDSVVELRGNGSGGTAILRAKSNGYAVLANTLLLTLRFSHTAPTVTPQGMALGIVDGTPGYDGKPTNGIFLHKLDAGNFLFHTRSGGSSTTTDLGFTGATEQIVIIEYEAATPSAKVYVGTFNAAGLKGTHTTNMPSTSAAYLLAGNVRNSTGAAVTLRLDTIDLVSALA